MTNNEYDEIIKDIWLLGGAILDCDIQDSEEVDYSPIKGCPFCRRPRRVERSGAVTIEHTETCEFANFRRHIIPIRDALRKAIDS